MGLLSTLLPERRAQVGPGTVRPAESASWLESLTGGGVSTAGRRVTADSAMTVGAVYASIRLLASSVGQLPLQILRRTADGKREELRGHRLWSLLNDAPNEFLTAIEFRELMMSWAILHGNGVAFLELSNGGSIESMIPIPPDRVRFWLTPDRTSMVYEYLKPNGGSRFLPRDQVFHLRAPLGSQWVGHGLLALARDAIGLGMVAEEHASRFYSNAAAPAGVLQSPRTLKKDTFQKLKEQWNSRHQGAENAFKTAILEDGLEWKPIALNLKDQQFLETRTFQVQEIARWVGIPPHLIGELTRSTNNNIEAQGIEFVTYALGPWCIRWEQRIRLDCLGESDRKTIYAKHRLDAFLRGQTLARYQAYQIGRMGGWLSPNDIRRSEDQDPIGPDGDIYLAPLNMVPSTNFGDQTNDDGTSVDSGANPPSVSGDTRATPATIESRVAQALGPMHAALSPLFADAIARCDRRARGELATAEKRSHTIGDSDAELHRQFCASALLPVVDAFSSGLQASLQMQDPGLPLAVGAIAMQLAHEAASEFRAGRLYHDFPTSAITATAERLAATAITSLLTEIDP